MAIGKSHHCANVWRQETEEFTFESAGWGPAIEGVAQHEDGSFWVSNSEYSTRVNFCPFCGCPAPSQVEYRGGES